MRLISLLILLITCRATVFSQEDTTSLLGEVIDDSDAAVYTTAIFKTNRIINLHSIENTAPGVMDFKISHRFGSVNDGFYDLFGLDEARMRLGLDLGITNRLAIGVGRSNHNKVYDGFVKYKLLRQRNDNKMPLSLAAVLGMGISTVKWSDPARDNKFTSRLYYLSQLLIARKFSEGFSMQLTPTLLHRNLVATSAEKNDVIAIGVGLRQKLTRRISINAEYIYTLPDQLQSTNMDAIAIGFDIETGGHVFQLHFTNSQGMNERAFITDTYGDWSNLAVHFGFNITRVFTLWNTY